MEDENKRLKRELAKEKAIREKEISKALALKEKEMKQRIALSFEGTVPKSKDAFIKKFNLSKNKATIYEKKDDGIRYMYSSPLKEVIKINIKTDKINNLVYDTPNNESKNKLNIMKEWGLSRLQNKQKMITQNKTIYRGKVVVFKSLDDLYDNKTVINLMFSVTMKMRVSDTTITRTKQFMYNGKIPTEDEAKAFVDKNAAEYATPIVGDDGVEKVEIDYSIISEDNNHLEFTFKEDGKMQDIKPYTIKQLYSGDIIDIKPTENCVRDYIREIFKKGKKYEHIYKLVDGLGTKEGVSPNELLIFCKTHNIKNIIYDINGNIITSFYPSKITINKSIIGIYYNGHFTPINNIYLNKQKPPTEQIQQTRHEITENFNKLLTNKEIPLNIKLYISNEGIIINEYEYDGKKYFGNDKYNECKDILSIFGIEDKIFNNINYSNISDSFDALLKEGEVSSFFPIKTNITAYNWSNPLYDTEEKINKVYKKLKAIDANKLYSHILRRLRQLPCVDYKQAKINYNISFDNIQNDYIYLCKPTNSHILMPATDYYDGLYLKQIKEDYTDYEILHEMEIQMKNNHYAVLIDTLYDKIKDKDAAKDIINRMIGKMNAQGGVYTDSKIIKVCNEQEMTESGETSTYMKYNDDIYFQTEIESTVHTVKNKRLIRAMVIRYANKYVFDKMKEMKLTTEKIIRIKTDEITFINDGEFQKIQKQLDKDIIGGWKNADIKPASEYIYKPQTVCNNNISKDAHDNTRNILNNCYAGSGKTFEIINKLIQEIKERNESFIVLCPTHSTVKDYKRANIRCSVIQLYTHYSNIIPKEKNIIIDEIGLCDDKAHELIYKCSLLSKNIYAYGDFKQLLPVNQTRHYNSPEYINYMFGTIVENSNNYRNNFTKEYYDSLINEKVDIREELRKHFNISKDYTKADVILCHSNTQCTEYNKLMLLYHKLNKFDVGAKIICTTNTCKTLRELGIFNKFSYIIQKYDYNTVYLDDTDTAGNQICFNKNLLNSNFESNYAMNFYNAQGQQFKSIYVPENSINNPHMSGRMAYTIISRLKEDIQKRQKDEEEFIINFDD